MCHGHEFFEAAVDATERLGRRTMLLSKFPEHLPAKLPALARHFFRTTFAIIANARRWCIMGELAQPQPGWREACRS